ncbi:unnamed protein product [Linum trigynum]|uniref:Uncharacterized protein n=1 Tax=Linum trigynum TaxID=586398 RepID=A0AAV2E5G8_9ROSI
MRPEMGEWARWVHNVQGKQMKKARCLVKLGKGKVDSSSYQPRARSPPPGKRIAASKPCATAQSTGKKVRQRKTGGKTNGLLPSTEADP